MKKIVTSVFVLAVITLFLLTPVNAAFWDKWFKSSGQGSVSSGGDDKKDIDQRLEVPLENNRESEEGWQTVSVVTQEEVNNVNVGRGIILNSEITEDQFISLKCIKDSGYLKCVQVLDSENIELSQAENTLETNLGEVPENTAVPQVGIDVPEDDSNCKYEEVTYNVEGSEFEHTYIKKECEKEELSCVTDSQGNIKCFELETNPSISETGPSLESETAPSVDQDRYFSSSQMTLKISEKETIPETTKELYLDYIDNFGSVTIYLESFSAVLGEGQSTTIEAITVYVINSSYEEGWATFRVDVPQPQSGQATGYNDERDVWPTGNEIEQVKCIFDGTNLPQRCYPSYSYDAGCSGVGVCIATITGSIGDKITWKSSCGQYVTTIIDGENDYAKFDCSNINQEQQLCTTNIETNEVVCENNNNVNVQNKNTQEEELVNLPKIETLECSNENSQLDCKSGTVTPVQHVIKIRNVEGVQEFKEDGFVIQSETPIEIKDDRLVVINQDMEREVKVMPTKLSDKIENIDKVKLKIVNEEPVYEVKHKEDYKFLGFINTKLTTTTDVSAETEEVLGTKKSLLAFISKQVKQ
ncbi:MAG: hypothetical protein V1663_03930 [archaeon]